MKNGPYELIVPPSDYPGKRYRGKYAYEHHVVWWTNTGRTVPPGCEVHHKNGQKRDNRFENLELLTSDEHKAHHSRNREIPDVIVVCAWCESEFSLAPRVLRKRRKKNNNSKVFCSA